jgi:hypothetical protein
LKQDDDAAKQSNHRCMARSIEESKPHRSQWTLLNARDVCDSSYVIVVETMPESEDGTRDKRNLKWSNHRVCLIY